MLIVAAVIFAIVTAIVIITISMKPAPGDDRVLDARFGFIVISKYPSAFGIQWDNGEDVPRDLVWIPWNKDPYKN